MEESGFKEIVTLECLIREFQVRKIVLPSFDPDRQVAAPGIQPIAGQKRKAQTSDPDVPMDSAETGDNSKEPVIEDPDRDGIKDAQGANEDAIKDDQKDSDIKEE